MKHLLFIFNPSSGKARIRTQLFQIAEFYTNVGYQVTVYLTRTIGDTIYNARKYKGRPMDLAQAHYNYAKQIPETIKEYIPEELRNHLTEEIERHQLVRKILCFYKVLVRKWPQNIDVLFGEFLVQH